jgi:phosphopentomutase
MTRAILLVLDSFGCGAAEDAGAYGDAGADTLGHIAEGCAEGRGDRAGLRRGPLHLPHLGARGLGLAGEASTGRFPPGLPRPTMPTAQYGYGVEISAGEDTPSGHWEMTGAPASAAFCYFPDTQPAFPPELTQSFIEAAGLPGILGDRHASGLTIIEDLGAESLRTGKPICYTSADSVFQIAAHEEAFGLARLYEICAVARRLCDPLNVGRVIARPFVGASPADFKRTANRKDFAVPPPPGNLLERASGAGREIVSIGKIGDIFAHRNTGREIKGANNMQHVDQTLAALKELPDGGLVFANFVDFDTEHGHRRDIAGYAAALEAFDVRLPEIDGLLKPGDLVIVTADHGNDPSFRGTDHTREHVPILAWGPGLPCGPIGRRATFADIGATIARHLGLGALASGTPWN